MSEVLVGDLERALAERELSVAFQPQFELASRRVVAFELLIRWRHPDQGDLVPDDFIPVAEQSGLINQLGAFVVEEACTAVSHWRARGVEVEVAVNISALQLSQPSFFADMHAALDECPDAIGALILELTETQPLPDAGLIASGLASLADRGVKISIDDVGTGNADYTLAASLPIHELKIDRTLIAALDAERQEQVAEIMSFAKAHHLRVVAEGVETEAQLELVERIGCDRAQGFLLARPGTRESADRVLLGAL